MRWVDKQLGRFSSQPPCVGLMHPSKRHGKSSPAAWCNECESGARNLLGQKDANHSRKHMSHPYFNPGAVQNKYINCTLQHVLHSHTEGYRILTPAMNEYHLHSSSTMILLTIFNLRHLFQYLQTPHFADQKTFPQKICATSNSQRQSPNWRAIITWSRWSFGNSAGKFFGKVFHQLGVDDFSECRCTRVGTSRILSPKTTQQKQKQTGVRFSWFFSLLLLEL